MTARRLPQLIVTELIVGLLLVGWMAMPPREDAANEKAQRLAEAKMKARIFTKYPDPLLATSEWMAVPVSFSKDYK